MGLYVSYSIGVWKLVTIHVFCATGLWFYSTTFKRKFLIGNVVVAAFIAIVPLIVGIYELLPCYKFYALSESGFNFKGIWMFILVFSFFAFIITLLREIIKDIEDYQGDKEYGSTTIPIVLEKKSAKAIVIGIAILTMLCLGYVQLQPLIFNDLIAFNYFVFGLQLPFTLLIYKIIRAETSKAFHTAGTIAKIIMLIGICYLFVFSNHLLSHIHVI